MHCYSTRLRGFFSKNNVLVVAGGLSAVKIGSGDAVGFGKPSCSRVKIVNLRK
jgi:hypothetical protein